MVQGACAYTLIILWVASGLAKLIALDNFRAVLTDHGVLSERAIALAWVVPALEVVLGAGIFVAHGARSGRWLRMIAGSASVALLLVFCVYISQVPEGIFRTVGCGCQGAFGLTDLVGSPSRAAAIMVNFLLVGVSLALWLPTAPPAVAGAAGRPAAGEPLAP